MKKAKNKPLTQYTDRELLKKFAKAFAEYDSLRTSELESLGNNGDRDNWDEEMESDFDELTDEIVRKSAELDEMVEFIGKLR